MNFLKKLFSKERPPADLSILKTDIHSHLIPGIDDGSKSMKESLELLKELSNFGYEKIITTPHVMSDYYKNTPEIILSGLEKLQQAVKEKNIPIKIEAAAEYLLDFDFQKKIGKEKLLTFGGNHLLFELSFFTAPEGLENSLFKMQIAKYKPVLAHPERYTYWHGNFDQYHKLKDRGILFQININSLTGHYSGSTKKIVERLIKEDLVDFLGSDCHNSRHIDIMKEAQKSKYLKLLLESGNLKNKLL